MSEYQYFEFLAIDRPLTEHEIDKLKALSTRATITPVSFTNEYNWGNFRGDPDNLMRRKALIQRLMKADIWEDK